jgi:hypothetical protein
VKPNPTLSLYRRDHVEETVAMRLDENSLVHLAGVLTNLYSNKYLAVLREYSTNALDSHVDAGIDRPIEVTLPTEGHRQLIIEDFGVGLSVDDIRRIYSAYGASTKRESDDVTGMLGLGSKSGLTYTNAFTVESVKGGVKVIATVTKDEGGVGSIKILDTFGTDEDNGVRITVPVLSSTDVWMFRNEAERFFSYWRGGVLVDGKEPERVSGFQIDPDVILTDDHQRFIVMGNVPYPVDGYVERGWVAWVEMGAVDFTPSREALHMTDRTKDTIATVEHFVTTTTERVVQQYLAEAKTGWDLALRYREITKNAGYRRNMARHFKQLEVPRDRAVWNLHIDKSGDGSSSQARGFSIFTLIDVVLKGTVVVRDFPYQRVSKVHRQRLALMKPDVRDFLLLPATMDLSTYDGAPWVSWEDVPELPKAEKGSRPKANVNYTTYVDSKQTLIDQNLIDDANEDERDVVYTDDDERAAALSRLVPDCLVVALRSRQVAKFTRLYPSARDIDEVLRERFVEVAAKVTEEDLVHASLESGDARLIESLRGAVALSDTEVTDPEVAELLSLDPNTCSDAVTEVRRWLKVRPGLWVRDWPATARDYIQGGHRRYSYGRNRTAATKDLYQRYPLVPDAHIDAGLAPHLINYINDTYDKYYA